MIIVCIVVRPYVTMYHFVRLTGTYVVSVWYEAEMRICNKLCSGEKVYTKRCQIYAITKHDLSLFPLMVKFVSFFSNACENLVHLTIISLDGEIEKTEKFLDGHSWPSIIL